VRRAAPAALGGTAGAPHAACGARPARTALPGLLRAGLVRQCTMSMAFFTNATKVPLSPNGFSA